MLCCAGGLMSGSGRLVLQGRCLLSVHAVKQTHNSLSTCSLLLLLLLQPVEVEAAVRGELPAWLSGSLVVNGGGDYSHMNHMFDGYGLLAKVRLQGGKAWGAQRYVDSKSYRAYKREGEQQQQQQQQHQHHQQRMRHLPREQVYCELC
jgi:carotenoid cleavage dioxygenase-like enzyme